MRVAILGTGYVGLSTGVCLAEIGHTVTCIDVDKEKIAKLKQGISPIYEPGMEELLAKNSAAGRLFFTTSLNDGITGCEVIIIAVGTPEREDGSADLSFLEKAAISLAQELEEDAIIVIKSTVPVGTNDRIEQLMNEHLKPGISIALISNPEFLREGSALRDAMEGDRIVIGYRDPKAAGTIAAMYAPLNIPVLFTSPRSAEMIKYASNAFLATKISFINEIATLCEKVDADIMDVAKGMGMDRRIGPHFLKAGIGYGGSCFPKDVQALVATAKEHGMKLGLLQETVAINKRQRERFVAKIMKRFAGDVRDKKIALLGLAFKPNTDDMRESPAIPIARKLATYGANIHGYDPVASQNARKILGDTIHYAETVRDATAGADAVLIITDWPEFIELDWPRILKSMRQPIIFDGRNCLRTDTFSGVDHYEYYPIGRPMIKKG